MMSWSISMVRKSKMVWVGVALVLLLAPVTALAQEEYGITIEVAPRTLNIDSDGQVVTVHTDIAYWYVEVSTVYLNGVSINSWKADNRGNFVAKFLMEEIKTLDGLIIGDYNTLMLVGVDGDGVPFVGSQEIMVIEVSGSDGDPGSSKR